MPSEHRLHPTSILFSFAGSLKAFAVPAIVLFFSSTRSSSGPASRPGRWEPGQWVSGWLPGDMEVANWQFWFLLFLIPSTIAAVLRYLSFRIRYEGTELVIRSGILFRNERHVPYLRIQNLDAVRNVAHRLLGVTHVRVETGGGKAPEATISVLHETVFEEMRRRVFEGRARARALTQVPGDLPEQGPLTADSVPAAAPAAAPADEARTLLHLPIRELLLLGFLENRGMLLVGAAYGLLWELGLARSLWNRLLADDWYAPGLVRDTMLGLAAGERPAVGQIALLLAGLVGLLAVVRVMSMIWAATRLYDFRLTRAGEDLRTEYGLLTRVTTTIPLRRVQTLTIREGPLQRLVKRKAVRVETAGGHGAPHEGPKKEREWLAPIVRSIAAPALVREVLPVFDVDGLAWQRLHPRAFRRAMKPALLISLAVSAPLIGLFGWRGLPLVPLILAWMTLVCWKQAQRAGWAVTEDLVVFRSGWLWRSLTVAPVAKIQAVACTESPFDRRAAMAGVKVDTAGANERSHRLHIPYLARETAQALHDRLAAQASQTAFRW